MEAQVSNGSSTGRQTDNPCGKCRVTAPPIIPTILSGRNDTGRRPLPSYPSHCGFWYVPSKWRLVLYISNSPDWAAFAVFATSAATSCLTIG